MRLVVCRVCQHSLPITHFYPGLITPGVKRSRCKSCSAKSIKIWRTSNPEKSSAINARSHKKNIANVLRLIREYKKRNPDKFRAWSNARQRRVRNFIPAWADMEKIKAVYEEARRITKETGIPHEVDHIVPLNGKTVSGLHVHGNLQIIRADENRKKSSKFEGELTCSRD